MILLTACSSPSCESFHQIRDLSDEEKKSLKQSKVSDEWLRDIRDFRDTYKKLCE